MHLYQGEEDGDNVITPALKVDEKGTKERRDGTENKSVCPQVCVLTRTVFSFEILDFWVLKYFTLQTTLTSQNFPVTNASEKS